MHRRPADNPFRVDRLHEVEFRIPGGVDACRRRFEDLGRCAALVGPEGSGKTTLRERLERSFAREGWEVRRLRIRSDRRIAPADLAAWCAPTSAHTLLSIDGVEQLSFLTWRRLRRLGQRAPALLVTSHRPCRMRILHRHRTDPGLLEAVVTELAGPQELDYAALWQAHHGNVRECLLTCYDLWQTGQLPPAR